MIFEIKERFRLSDKFLDQFKGKQPKWGPLGYVTYKRTYSRYIESENRNEEFWETLKRVVEGCYTIQLNHCRNLRLPWNAHKAQKSAQEMYRRMWEFKFLPPGRGLWAMGTDVVWKKGSASLNNCAFISTKDLKYTYAEPFVWLMDMCMFGVGVAFDTKGAGEIKIIQPKTAEYTHVVEDTRESWCEAVRVVIDAYFGQDKLPNNFDFSKIRPSGSIIKTFGGIAPGPDPLIKGIEEIKEVLNKRIDQFISSVDIVDLMNIVGKIVVSGGIRRTAELSLGYADDKDYLEMKDYVKYEKELLSHRWASNNSIYAHIGMDYTDIAKQAALNGEPGFVYLKNMQNFGRMKDGFCEDDAECLGTNPCSEMSLHDGEMCCLVEVFPSNHDTKEDFIETLKHAYLYAKTVTLVPSHHEKTNQVMLRNRRIGISLSGIVDAIDKFGRRNFLYNFCDNGYNYIVNIDKKYSNWLCIPRSIKKTTVKPSGSISLLPGVSPGIHYPHAKFYKRRIEVQKTSPLVEELERCGYKKEQSVYKENSWVFEFPIKTENYSKGKNEVSIWEQMALHADIQYYWSDNNVSQTVTFKKDEASDLKTVLETYEDKIKAISFLPISEHGYQQAPYEEISEEVYNEMVSKIVDELNFSNTVDNDSTKGDKSKMCDGDTCVV